jgi:hypothetical protein
LEVCYRIYYLFFPVAENCATYKAKGKELIIEASAKTVVLGKIVKPIHNWGVAISDLASLKPKEFIFYQREGSFKRDHLYKFYGSVVRTKIIKYRKKTDKVERVFEKVFWLGDKYVDPFTASAVIYKSIPEKKEGLVRIFYDGRGQSVEYKLVGEERVRTELGNFATWKVELTPNITTRGLLSPKGRWYIWIDKNSKIPVKLKVTFTIGTATGLIYKLKGNRDIFTDAW